MDEIVFGDFIRYTSLVIGIFGVLAGVDLVLGAKVIIYLKAILDKGTDIVDKAIVSAHSKRIFGSVILFLSLVILFLSNKIRM
ncbi:MAG: hypothetical protein WC532_04240 [Candidatus Omnitrophota bacterium]